MRVRFAPSPTGTLHIGSARTALFNWLFARHEGGSFVLRIDDTDVARSEARHEDSILADLRWLGLDWDEGPEVGGECGPYRQSERLDLYRRAADDLLATGQAYHCFCPEERLEELRVEALSAGRSPHYDRRCLTLSANEVRSRLAQGEPAAVRFAVPPGEIVVDDLLRGPVVVAADAVGDFIILRSDGVGSYNFASVVDDRDMRISHVIRGDDHLTNSARQVLLFKALGASVPRFAHHSLVLGLDGAKLSKRHGATSVGEYRERGYLPEAIVNYLALLSWSHGDDEVLSVQRLVEDFALEDLSLSAPVFDQVKLDWLAHEHVMALAPQEHERRFAERLPEGTSPQAAAALAAAFRPSLSAYDQAPVLASTILEVPTLSPELRPLVADAGDVLEEFCVLRAPAALWLPPDAARELLAALRSWGKQHGLGPRDVLMPLRVALTGAEHGPELPFVLAALSSDQALSRIAAARRECAAPHIQPPGDAL